MKKSIFAMMAFVVAAMLVGCSKDKENSEVAMTVSEITDSTAILKCEYSPAKSVSYKLQLGEAVSMEYSESMKFTAAFLNGGTKYDVVATTYDAEHNVVGTTVVNFRTTGEPDNAIYKDIVLTPQIDFSTIANDITVTVTEVTDTTAIFNCQYSQQYSKYYQLQFGEFVSEPIYFDFYRYDATNLTPGTQYSLYVTTYDDNGNQVYQTSVDFRTTGNSEN